MAILEEHECKEAETFGSPGESVDDILCYGPIIHAIVKVEDGWVAHNGEYASFIRFCPFCGERLGW